MDTMTWTKDEMLAEFDVIGFAFGLCAVKRKSDGQRGTLEFWNVTEGDIMTRVYGKFQPA
jgi:hypothetical protein